MRYISPQLRDYNAYMVDPVQIRTKRGDVKPEQRAEVARYLSDALVKVLTTGGYRVATQPGVGVARVRVAITDIQDAKWYLNIHPATKVSGAGRAGASMEAEVVDSVSGEQLAAAIRSGKGREFELNPFSTIEDVKSVIDQWAKDAGERLKELRESRSGS
jgi:phenylpyruvate tautomerase PptA (4-oxalocrotonate tautomerase family)